MPTRTLPELPLSEWRETKITLHLFAQIVGKVRLALHPPANHWWHVPLYVSARGITTRTIPTQGRLVELEFDFLRHVLEIRTDDGGTETISLQGSSVASFYHRVRESLSTLDLKVRIHPHPFDPAKCESDLPFARDTTHATYDPDPVTRLWRILSFSEGVFREFGGRFLGKCSPVHLFWHSFDLAVTRFSGRPVAVSPDADEVTRRAYSHEVISAGFWAGDDSVPEPAYYVYAHPEPEGLASEPLEPRAARWRSANGSSMAIFTYADLRASEDPRSDLLRFLESAYGAGARRGGWPEGLLLSP